MTAFRQDQDQRPLAVTILLVEDDPGHAVLIENNLRSAGRRPVRRGPMRRKAIS